MRKSTFSDVSFKTVGYKALVYGAALFVLTVMQTTFFARLTLFGATPDLLCAAVITLAMLEGERTGGVCGIAAGAFAVFLGGASVLYIPFSFFCGYIFGIVSKHAFAKNYPSALALMGFAFLAKGFFNLIDTSLLAQSFDLPKTLLEVILPELFYSALLCTPIYFIFSALAKIFRRSGRERKYVKFK